MIDRRRIVVELGDGRRLDVAGSSRRTADTRSRTSWAAMSTSRFSSNVATTSDAPRPEIERSSAMPSTVLTASSIRCEICDSISSGEAPGRPVRTRTVGQVDGREPIDAQAGPSRRADDDEREHEHAGEDGATDAEGGK